MSRDLIRFAVYLSSAGQFSDPLLLADLAQEAEEAGWEGVFIWDHMGQPPAAADPWIALAAMAMQTTHVRLGPMVTPLARRRPWKVARETVTLDHLSRGRLTLGVGLGWSAQEFAAFGEDADPRVRAQKLDEGLAVLDGLWKGDRFSYQGQHYQLTDVCFQPRPLQSPRIPLWACGTWPEFKAPFRRAARWDGVLAILNPTQQRAISPAEVSAIKSYVARQRQQNDPFDIAVILWSEGDKSRQELAMTSAYAGAGVTWWLEDLSTERFATLPALRERLRRGRPGM